MTNLTTSQFLSNAQPGWKVEFEECPNEMYTVMVRDARYIICRCVGDWMGRAVVVPDPRGQQFDDIVISSDPGQYAYTILDIERGERGPDNLVFHSGYDSAADCEARLKELQAGDIEVSRRSSKYVPIKVRKWSSSHV